MRPDARRPKPEKPREPEYTWGDCPAGAPPLLWQHAARPLWVQTAPERDSVLLMEKERLSFRQISTGAVLWEQAASDLPDEVAVDGASIVLALGRELRDLDPATGAPRWKQRPGGEITVLALDERTVYAATQGPLFVLDRATGKLRWRTPCGWEPELHPHPEAGLLVVDDAETESLRAYASEDGRHLWDYEAEGQPLVAGPLVQGLLFVSGHAAGVAAVEAQSGEVRWRLESEGAFEAAGVVSEAGLFFNDGTIYAVDPATGEVRWRRILADEDDKVFSIRLDGGALFAETWRGKLLALDPADGAVRWERTLGQVHGLTGDGRRFYVRTHIADPEERWAIFGVDRATGDLAWEIRARRLVPDLTEVEGVLVVELKNQVLALKTGS